jgi:hypothetical protein
MLTVNLTETCSCGASLAVSAEETTVDRLLLEWRERPHASLRAHGGDDAAGSMNRPPRTCALCLDLEGFHSTSPYPNLPPRCEACAMHGRHDPEHEFTSGLPRAFALVRPKDASGISGTGLVMQGVVFVDGRVAARWVTEDRPRSTVLWDDFDAWYDVHVRPHPENESVVLFEDGHDGYDRPSLPQRRLHSQRHLYSQRHPQTR